MTDTGADPSQAPIPSSAPASALRDPAFTPPSWLSNAHLQSILPSLRLRRPLLARRTRALLAASRPRILDCGEGVRLLGHLSSHEAEGLGPSAAGSGKDAAGSSKDAAGSSEAAAGFSKGAAGSSEDAADRPAARDLVVLLHGWEGHADSMHVLSLGSQLFELGCDVFRLNFRDHGASHHLNEGIFHSCRLDEVLGAVRCLHHQLPERRITVAGFSLGGNFTLRVAARAPAAGIPLRRAIAICPVLHPHSTLDALEHGWSVYRRYFISRWKRSLQLKQRCFPDRYDFGPLLAERSIRSMTRVLVERYSEFPDLDTYLNGYSLAGGTLARLEVPSHLLYSLDDPIIPARDIGQLACSPALEIVRIPRGGHCGFMDGFSHHSWADRRVACLMGLA